MLWGCFILLSYIFNAMGLLFETGLLDDFGAVLCCALAVMIAITLLSGKAVYSE